MFGGDGPDEWAEFEHKPKVRRRVPATLVSIDRSLPKTELQNLLFQDDHLGCWQFLAGFVALKTCGKKLKLKPSVFAAPNVP